MIIDNNPGNLKASRTFWQGERATSSRPGFEAFETLEDGVRALARCSLTHWRGGARTVSALLDLHAPHTPGKDENPHLEEYKRFVANRVGVGGTDPVDLERLEVLEAYTAAVCRFETGVEVPGPVIVRGCLRALGVSL